MAGLTAEEFQLLREAVDERRCRDGTGAGVHSEAGAPYRRTWIARGTALAAPGGTVSSLPTSRSGAAAVAAGGSPPPGAPSSSTAERRSPPGSPQSGSCAPSSPSSARPSCAASATRRTSSGGAARSPRQPAIRTGLYCATPSGLTRPTSTTQTPPRATNECISVVYPVKSRASESPSMSIGTPSRSSSATGSPARRAQ